MIHQEQQYLDLLQKILDNGDKRMDRTGTGTLSLFGEQMRFNLSQGFPAITTKKLAWKACVSELLWFIEGSGDEKRLKEILHGDRNSEKATIWTGNVEAPYWKPKAKFEGDLGRVYGQQWRFWRSPTNKSWWQFRKKSYSVTDQLVQLIEGIKNDPFGRRHILTAWNPGELDQMGLPPCHMFAQFYVSEMEINERVSLAIKMGAKFAISNSLNFNKNPEAMHAILDSVPGTNNKVAPRYKLSCQMYQRSGDTFLGIPFNIASYALFTHMIAQVCNMAVGEFVHVIGDAHVYANHIDQAKEQISRTPFTLPTLWLNPEIKDITKFTMDDIRLDGYQSHTAIKAPMAV
jgi:thymidylate synthase